MNADDPAAIDIVYTWVDDSFPGYREILGRYAHTSHDVNPNRTRDNLDIIKYSLRSVAAHVPFARHIYIVSCAPQVPQWLAKDRPGLTVVHHDALLESSLLPMFNSFAIASSIGGIPGLSHRFLYVEDDMIFGRQAALSDFCDESGRLRLFPHLNFTRAPVDKDRDDLSPWNTGLAYSNHLLDESFGPKRRRHVNHVPLLIDRDYWDEMLCKWKIDFTRTRASRFRAKYNAVPEYLYPYFLYYTGRARMESMLRTYRDAVYCPLENSILLSWPRLLSLRLRRPRTITLNDNFGARPNPRVVSQVSAYLEEAYPAKSPFEA